MRHLFIINPLAGNGSYRRFEAALKHLVQLREDILVEKTQYKGHCEQILKKYKEKDIGRVYVLGGDGSINELLNAIMKNQLSAKMALGIIPCGSGNDYIKNFTENYEAEDITQPLEYLSELLYSDTMKVDIGQVNEDYFINIISVGFDAEVIKNSYLFKKNILVPNKSAYFISAMYTLWTMKAYPCKVSTDTGYHVDSLMMASIGNGCFYGGGMKVLPNADVSDGLMDVCIVAPLNKRRFLFLIKTFIEGKHQFIKEVSMFRANKIEICSQEPIACQYDGELKNGRRWKIRLLSKKIDLIKPI